MSQLYVAISFDVPAGSLERNGDVQLGHRDDSAADRRAEEVRGAVASVDRSDRHQRKVWRDYPDRLQERIGQTRRPHHSIDVDSNPRRAWRGSRPGVAGSWAPRVRLWNRRTR